MNIDNFVKSLREANSNGFHPNVFVYQDCVWSADDSELSINTEANKEDLESGDGDTYGFDFRFCEESSDGYVIFHDAENGSGNKDTVIVLASERVEIE